MTSRNTRKIAFGLGIGASLTLGALAYFADAYQVGWYLNDTGLDGPPRVAVAAATPEPAPAPAPAGVDLSNVAVGQRYHFMGLDASTITVWEVQEITPTLIRYQELEVRDGVASSLGTFAFPRRAVVRDAALRSHGRETLHVEGARFECEVLEAQGVVSWSSPAFPGTIRSLDGERVLRELVKVERS